MSAGAGAIDLDPELVRIIIPFLGGLAGALLGILWNYRNAKKLRREAFLAKQMELCFEASTVVATLAMTVSKKAFDEAHARFLVLFWGPLSIIENRGVSNAMIQFRKALNASIEQGERLPLNRLRYLSYHLAKEVQTLVLKAREIEELGDLLDRRDLGPEPRAGRAGDTGAKTETPAGRLSP